MWIHWPFFPKTWTKGHWPLDDLWPHVCWGHMCDSTQGSLCPSPMTKHQCMWIQWSICKLPHTYIHILRTYYVHTTYYVQNEWSHSLLLNSVQARQKLKRCFLVFFGGLVFFGFFFFFLFVFVFLITLFILSGTWKQWLDYIKTINKLNLYYLSTWLFLWVCTRWVKKNGPLWK